MRRRLTTRVLLGLGPILFLIHGGTAFLSKNHHTRAFTRVNVPTVSRVGKPKRQHSLAFLYSQSSPNGDGNNSPSGIVLNKQLVRQTILNQILIGFTIWTGGAGAQALEKLAQFNTGAVVLGAVGVLPLIYLSRQVETSESTAVADLNLSTNLLLLRLFGDRPQPILAATVSIIMAGLTGLVEETTFRGQLLPKMAQSFNSLPAAFGLSTLLFAVLHINPIATFRGGLNGLRDATVLVAYQVATGAWFATLGLLSQNLAVPIIAHALFDFYVFFATHLVVTKQMEYARAQVQKGPGSAAENKWRQERGADFVLGARETFYLADTNRDGVLSRAELRIALYSYGITLSRDESETITATADIDDSGTIDFGEFLDFVGPTGSPAKAIKQSLLGVNG